MFTFDPKESRAERTKQPLVTSAHHKISAQSSHIHGHRTATLARIEKQQSTLLMARRGNAWRVQQRTIVVAHQADGNDAGPWRHCRDEIISREKALTRRDNLQLEAFPFFHGKPCCVLQWELPFGDDDFVAGIPLQCVGYRGGSCAGSAGERNFLWLSSDEFRNVFPDAVWNFEVRGIRFVMRKFLGFKRGLHSANGNARQR